MNYTEKLEEVNSLKKEIEKLLPLSDESSKKLWEKLNLEWNYNSNHIEGNTLTYDETKLFLLLGNTSGDHKAREYDEMKAHNVAIETVKLWAGDKNRIITEKEIRELNKIILVSPFWKDAETIDGLRTQKEIIPGEYKRFPNNVRLENGNIFWYSKPEEVAPLMKELLEWYHTNDDLNPITKASIFHYRFVRIHPFDDGNGRIARLLMNYHLIRNEFMPIIVKSNDKRNYIFALNKADSGDEQSFVEYITIQAIWSMELLLKAAKNESVEEAEDWKKRASNLSKNISQKSVKRNYENFITRFHDSILPTLIMIRNEIIDNYKDLFEKINLKFIFNSTDFTSDFVKDHFDMIENHIKVIHNMKDLIITFELAFRHFNRNGIYVFNIDCSLQVDINEYSYSIRSKELDLRISKSYDKEINQLEMKDFTNTFARFIQGEIDKKIN